MKYNWQIMPFTRDGITRWMVTDMSRPFHETYLLHVFKNEQAAQDRANELNGQPMKANQ